ncbi:MAG: thiamine-phosphate kinase [Xanthomonadaceae bacterium]|nr:thiamine-phosphate kinase [Xanthomonadaceae bacterium]
MAEFDLIEHIRRRLPARDDVVLGIGDDAALLRLPESRQLAVTADTLNAGVHFPHATAPADIGWKALAVNLSDLAAMGAQPAWCTLALSLPKADPDWLDAFIDGFLELALLHRTALVGGDTTRGPLSISVTAVGWVEPGKALRRDGAQPGDDVWVTGTLGDAAAALRLWQAGLPAPDALMARLDRPTPRVETGRTLNAIAHACIDLSDGLLADLGHICTRSSVAAEIELDALPASDTLREHFDQSTRWQLQTGGGDDYELCFTAPAQARDAIAALAREGAASVSRIGRLVAGAGIRAFDANGGCWHPERAGYEHFFRTDPAV